jgi:hypothetical protein
VTVVVDGTIDVVDVVAADAVVGADGVEAVVVGLVPA